MVMCHLPLQSFFGDNIRLWYAFVGSGSNWMDITEWKLGRIEGLE